MQYVEEMDIASVELLLSAKIRLVSY